MQFFCFLAAFLLIRRLRILLKDSHKNAKWQSPLSISSAVIVILFFGSQAIFNHSFNSFLGSFLLGAIVLYVDQEADFKSIRPFIRAHFPLVIASFLSSTVQAVSPVFYKSSSDYFQFAIVAAFVWIFARWANTKKQQEELRIVSDKRAELEILVAERTEELTRQKNELQDALQELKATQSQLIQSEKMASLGELTAGIAHEIQNPLNFINNFSDLNAELIAEMKDEIEKGKFDEVKAIADDIKQNEIKISTHGRRADAIVKGMLQHSRASSGKKEPTDINALADEYLRLSYHGLRAKDKSFNAIFKTDFDESIGKVEVIPQDIGRVLLNLYNNAFYSVNEKKKQFNAAFEPTVSVTTKRITSPSASHVEIVVKDNGIGIPQKIIDKIYQPFFTTKPTGQGTGLGLSLSYDIIKKGHNGKLEVISKDQEGAEFIIQLPLA